MMASRRSVEPAREAPAVHDLVLANPGPSLWLVTAVREESRGQVYDVVLVGPSRPNSALGRVVHALPAADILAVYRAIQFKEPST